MIICIRIIIKAEGVDVDKVAEEDDLVVEIQIETVQLQIRVEVAIAIRMEIVHISEVHVEHRDPTTTMKQHLQIWWEVAHYNVIGLLQHDGVGQI